MERARIWTSVFGFLFVALALVGYILGPGAVGNTSAATQIHKYTTFYAKHGNQVKQSIAAVLFVFAVFSFLWFVGGLWSRLRNAEGAAGPLANTALAGGVTFAALFAVAGLLSTAVGSELSFSKIYRFDVNQAIFFNYAGYAAMIVALLSAAVLMFSTWALARRTRVLPQWLAWVGFVFGIATLGVWATAWFMFFGWLIWVLLTSIVFLLPGAQAQARTATPAAAA